MTDVPNDAITERESTERARSDAPPPKTPTREEEQALARWENEGGHVWPTSQVSRGA
jgi:hypothetical protein